MSALANRIRWLVLVFGIGIPQVGASEPPRVQLARDGQPRSASWWGRGHRPSGGGESEGS